MTGFQREVLAALVDGTAGFTLLNPHNGGWPTGPNFRVNLVKDDQSLDSILAQSQYFNITASTSTTGLGTYVFLISHTSMAL